MKKRLFCPVRTVNFLRFLTVLEVRIQFQNCVSVTISSPRDQIPQVLRCLAVPVESEAAAAHLAAALEAAVHGQTEGDGAERR